jgi:regulator of protease activity HflC (stomatin/prohibitin superfamily)
MSGAYSSGGCGCVSVPTASTGILFSFGEYSRTLAAGLSCYVCCSGDVWIVPNKTQQFQVKTSSITQDNVNVTIETDIIYHITPDNSFKAFTSLANPKAHFTSLVENSIRSHATTHTWGQLYSKRDELSDLVRGNLLKEAGDRGFSIERVVVVGVHLPRELSDAMNTKATNEQLRLAAVDKAEAERLTAVANARAEAERTTLLAHAKAEQMKLSAQAQAEVDRLKGVGIAQQRFEIAKGLEAAAGALGKNMGISVDEASKMVFVAQYLETFREVGANNRATLMFPYATTVDDIPKVVMQGMSLLGDKKHLPV